MPCPGQTLSTCTIIFPELPFHIPCSWQVLVIHFSSLSCWVQMWPQNCSQSSKRLFAPCANTMVCFIISWKITNIKDLLNELLINWTLTWWCVTVKSNGSFTILEQFMSRKENQKSSWPQFPGLSLFYCDLCFLLMIEISPCDFRSSKAQNSLLL